MPFVVLLATLSLSIPAVQHRQVGFSPVQLIRQVSQSCREIPILQDAAEVLAHPDTHKQVLSATMGQVPVDSMYQKLKQGQPDDYYTAHLPQASNS